MPPVFGIFSFFSYRFFRSYTYYSLAQVIYESFVLSAFLLLIIQYVATTSANRTAEDALARKDKARLIFPFCCLRYRPTKPYFMYTLKWSVMQYTIVRPACSIAGIITQYYHLLCETKISPYFAAVYIEAVDFASISIALMGLVVFYDLTKNELTGRRPLAKFLCIKLIVMVTWYQGFVFSMLQSKGIIKATQFWTASNVADGLTALATSIEMIIFAIFMWWAYPASEYYNRDPENPREEGYMPPTNMSPDEKERRKLRTTSIWRPIWDSINFSDFAVEIWSSFVFFIDYARGKPYAHSHSREQKTFSEAFNLDEPHRRGKLVKQRKEDRTGQGLMRIQTPISEVGVSPHSNRGMGDAYRMSPITSQPTPRHQPDSPGAQGLAPPQLPPEQRWSQIGVAM
ncbi:hypothetical protein M408DRAFT_328045 [Serendipita vermifera MAFF 305830]|uniref:DUF300-domain-containing protein n=1 Tax=Serendipita vermifera MAFF 305830 TaxID=933852 RepID=A0A0C2XN87_SERVB|nr:hypothetical protein M408DRAFT_328045 [Serendipita vermifera MAFF 305830]